MKGITYTQVAQYCVMAFAYTIPAVFIAIALTENFIPQLGFIGDYKADGGAEPFLDKLNGINEGLGFTKYTDGSLSTIDMFCITAALMCGTAGLPHVIVRFFTVKNVKAVRVSACWTLAFIAVIYLTAPAIGAFSRVNLIAKLNGTSYAESPQWFKDFEETGQMAWVDKNGDGVIQYSGPGKSESKKSGKAFEGKPKFDGEKRGASGERLLQNQVVTNNPNELYFGNDVMVMANPHMGGLPKWAIALLMAGCIAAALSTAAGLLLVLSTSISHDLMKKLVNPNLTDKEEVRWARIASFGSLLVAIYFGVNPPSEFVAKTVAFAFGLAASSFFPTLLLGIFSKRMNREGAIAGMVAGIGFTLAYIIYFQFGGGTKDQYWFGISPEGIGFVGMLVNFMVSGIVSLMTKEPPQEVKDLIDHVRYPDGEDSAPIDH